MGVGFISEKQDNFRDPRVKCDVPKTEQLKDFVQNENQTLIREKIYNNLLEKDEMERFTTEYREQSKKNAVGDNMNAQELHNYY